MQKFALILLLSAAAVACTDESPTRPAKPGEDGNPAVDARSRLTVLSCEASRSKLTVTCREPQLASAQKGPAADIIYGGQNTYVKVTSSNPAYNSGTGRFTFDITVKNLIDQPIGTTDGVNPASPGVRVFFGSGPTVTGGTGVATVLPDGFATFTAPAQPYYEYPGILPLNATSAPKTWTIAMPVTVDTFAFILFISSPVQYPDGYIEINGKLPGATFGNLQPGASTALVAQVDNQLSEPIPGAPAVTWGISDPTIASIDGSGNVTGIRSGTVVVTATSMGLNGSIIVNITGTSITWTGAVSSDWENPGNWAGGVKPSSADTAVIPVGVPNYPALTVSEVAGGIQVADLATLNLAAFDLTLTSLASTGQTAGSGVLGTTGTLILSGSGPVNGQFSLLNVTGSYTTANTVTAVAPLNITSGLLQTDANLIEINAQ
jgi:hypothetical protein